MTFEIYVSTGSNAKIYVSITMAKMLFLLGFPLIILLQPQMVPCYFTGDHLSSMLKISESQCAA